MGANVTYRYYSTHLSGCLQSIIAKYLKNVTRPVPMPKFQNGLEIMLKIKVEKYIILKKFNIKNNVKNNVKMVLFFC